MRVEKSKKNNGKTRLWKLRNKSSAIIPIKQLKILALTILLTLLTGCAACIKYPTRLVDDKGISLEPAACYDYKLCMYYVAIGKYQSDCKLEYIKCCKERNYIFCGKDDKRWTDSKSQECWDKLD